VPRNLITDVAGIRVGNAGDARIRTGVTVILCDEPAIASVHVMGGAPGTRETDLLGPNQTVEHVDAIVLSGGSAWGLDAASGVMDGLAAAGRGFLAGNVRVPIVPAAILFDLANGGDKAWGPEPPYRRLGRAAFDAVSTDFAIGTAGAGIGATTANLKGGLGSASTILPDGVTVGALVAVNALGRATIGEAGHFWAAPFEIDAEFGGRGYPVPLPDNAADIRHKLNARPGTSTTIAVIATDAVLTKAATERLAIVTHDGFAHALWPTHTPLDGDLVFSIATGRVVPKDPIALGAAAAATMARAIARAVYAATPAPDDLVPAWRERFG
jgi:L-aminopeptidase/D-esterase-like protein